MSNRAAAVERMAEALLRGTSGLAVMLRMPMTAMADDTSEELGLATPAFQDMRLWPVTFRSVWPKTAVGAAAQMELFVSAKAVEAMVGSLGFSAASILFATASGVLVDGTLLEIESASGAKAMGETYCYRLVLRAPLALAV